MGPRRVVLSRNGKTCGDADDHQAFLLLHAIVPLGLVQRMAGPTDKQLLNIDMLGQYGLLAIVQNIGINLEGFGKIKENHSWWGKQPFLQHMKCLLLCRSPLSGKSLTSKLFRGP